VVLPVTEFCPVSRVRTARKSFSPNLGCAIHIVNLNGTLEYFTKFGWPFRISKLLRKRSDNDDVVPLKILSGDVEKRLIDGLSKRIPKSVAIPVVRILLS
jgi:hypothetical protein